MPGKPILSDVYVNGRKISAGEIAAEAQFHNAPRNKPGIAWRNAARALVIRELLLSEADRCGIVAESRDCGTGRRETEPEARIRILLESRVSPPQPSDEELRAIHKAHPNSYRSPDLYEASHILFAASGEDAAGRSAARSRAQAVIGILIADPGRFARLAKEESDCPSGANGGRLGQVSGSDVVPEFDGALRQLSPGEIAENPVETRYGIHVIRLDAREEGRVLPFEAVRDRIAEAAEKVSWARSGQAMVRNLAAKASIEGIDLDFG